ncbi:hypothetical protein MC885_000972, partial [Smutsia gigantea]
TALQKETQEGIPPPTKIQEPQKPQRKISLPIHPPLIIKINFEEEEEEEDEENDAVSLRPKTAEEIEEERAIKEICYKSGDVLTVPTKYSLCEKQGEMKASFNGKPRTDLAAFENGVNDVHLVRQPHYKGMSKRNGFMMNQRTSLAQECREFKKVQAPNPQNKMSYHRNNKNRNAGNASYIHAHRDVVRPVKSNARPHSRPTNRSYNKANVNKEPKLNLCPDKYMSTSYNGSAWQKRIPFSKTYSKTEKIHTGKYFLIVKHELPKDMGEGDVTSEHETCTIHVWHKKVDVTRDELTKLLFSFNLEVTEEGTEKQ